MPNNSLCVDQKVKVYFHICYSSEFKSGHIPLLNGGKKANFLLEKTRIDVSKYASNYLVNCSHASHMFFFYEIHVDKNL